MSDHMGEPTCYGRLIEVAGERIYVQLTGLHDPGFSPVALWISRDVILRSYDFTPVKKVRVALEDGTVYDGCFSVEQTYYNSDHRLTITDCEQKLA